TVLQAVNRQPIALKDIVLEHNGITSRYYVIDRQSGRQTHTNAQLTAEAIRDLAHRSGFDLNELEVLASGTSSPDQLIPTHACMVHGSLACPPCELASLSGVCCSGMAALKYGYMSVLSGCTKNAVVTGSEIASVGVLIRNDRLQSNGQPDSEEEPFDSAFLRWMLSDGAGAILIEPHPRSGSISLRIDWVDVISLANELETCMYSGAVKAEDGSLRTWREIASFDNVCKDGYFNIAQDVRLLNDTIIAVAMRRSFERVRAKRALTPDGIDWLLPHLSSYYFRQPIVDTLQDMDFVIPDEK